MTALTAIPPPAARRLAVKVTPDAERQIRGGHPWVYDGSITSVSHDGAPGDLAVVFDRNRDFLAIGLWDPTSPIRVRVLHAGGPTPIDRAWFAATIARAVAVRAPLAESGHTDGYRLVHGENDGLPGLVVDRYDASVVVKLYSVAWFAHLAMVIEVLDELLAPERTVLRCARTVSATAPRELSDGAVLTGADLDGPVRFRESGLTFAADLARGHKTGHFLDQRDNRGVVAARAAGASVLDVFSSTGGFAVHAAAGGARAVDLVDVSAPALTTALTNLEANAEDSSRCRTTTTAGDAFAVLGSWSQQHDIVVIDPPSFANRRGDVTRALTAYRTLSALALPLVEPGGLLFQASCSSRVSEAELEQAVRQGAADVGADLSVVGRFGQPLDHPVGFAHGRYLKALLARIG